MTLNSQIYNEAATIRRLLEASANLDYPNLQVQVLDDSTDETTAIGLSFPSEFSSLNLLTSSTPVKDFLANYKPSSSTSPTFEHHRRIKRYVHFLHIGRSKILIYCFVCFCCYSRTGYKAGALKEALETATGDFICMFDADFVPRPDFVKSVMHRFEVCVLFNEYYNIRR